MGFLTITTFFPFFFFLSTRIQSGGKVLPRSIMPPAVASPLNGSAATGSSGLLNTAAASDPRDLAIFFEVLKLEHYVDAFVEHGFTMDNLHLVTESDLDKLRITNKRDKACLLGAVKMVHDENTSMSPVDRAERRRARAAKVRSFVRTVGPQERKAAAKKRQLQTAIEEGRPTGAAAAGGGVVMHVSEDGEVVMDVAGGTEPEPVGFTATVSTANEHARQATIFLNHHRADRPWPKAGSKLSQCLHLSGAAPVSYDPLYSIQLDGEKEVVRPPHKTNQGFSAKFCHTCADFVSEAMQGAWQYQVIEQILLGEGLYEDVAVWKPFNQTESMKIEYAHKRRQPSVKIGKAIVDFDVNLWGTKPIRRVDTDAVPFPTLKRKDLAPVPQKNVEPQEAMLLNIQELQRELVSETEERRSRLFLEQLEQKELVQVLAEIAAMMDAYHYSQRLALEEEETAARAKWEIDDYEKALDKIFEWEEQSVRDVALRKWERESERVMRGQYALLEDMETIARSDVEAEEAAFRANLDKLMALFNQQVREFQDAKRRKELRSRRNQDGKPRCPVCRKFDCDFFCHPWKGQWKHNGGALELDLAPNRPTKTGRGAVETLSTLVNRANEKEYDEYLLNRKAARSDRKSQRRLKQYLGDQSSLKLLDAAAQRSHSPPLGGAATAASPLPGHAVQTSEFMSPAGGAPSSSRPTIDRTANRSASAGDVHHTTLLSPIGDDMPPRPGTADPLSSPTQQQPHGVSARLYPPRPQSAQSIRSIRSASASGLHGATSVFHNAVGNTRQITPDSIHQNTKQTRVRVMREVTKPVQRAIF
ncbi:Hypothetical protein, putative [Bodo saltans]|uniref:SAM domain-containing protein n=1 Tax=Bodo saltans TaxID=75058 RepID=A0A0S4JRM0_BODSA|nr:Hypothetical protein, putative [Bodo saltans]|eukprot:CUG92032.1 Hypothetical protein, putative [Bodo saltans]